MNTRECLEHIKARKHTLLVEHARMGIGAIPYWKWTIRAPECITESTVGYLHEDEAAQAAVKWFDEREPEKKGD